MRAALIVAVLLVGAPAAAQVGKKPAAPAPPVCRLGETPVFACRAGAKVAAVCTAPGRTSYRYGPPGKVEIQVASNGKDGRAYRSSVSGQGGGHQETVRFRNGVYSYLVSDGVQGRLAERPGKTWSVVTVMKGQDQVASLACQPIGKRGGLGAVNLPDDPDENFVGWY